MRYQFKRVLSLIWVNSQSIRWNSQEPIIRKFWNKYCFGNKAIDYGCGGGTYAIEFPLKKGCLTTLCDLDDTLLATARSQVDDAGFTERANFILLDQSFTRRFSDEKFNIIQCFEVLEHIDNPEFILSEFNRMSQTGGYLLLSVPHPPEWIPNPGHVVDGYTIDELKRMFASAGWSIIEHEYCMFLFSRWLFLLLSRLGCSFPFPLFILRLENLLPRIFRNKLIPYDIVVVAQKKHGESD